MTADDQSALADEFEAHRSRLRLLATRLLGSPDEADDVIQETWIRLRHAQTRETTIVNLGGWLTTVASRVCVDTMRRHAVRREVSVGDRLETLDAAATDQDPADLVLAAATVTPALLAVLDRLTPPERVAFVLHDTFSIGFAAVADVLDVTPAAARQLASRGAAKCETSRPASVATLLSPELWCLRS